MPTINKIAFVFNLLLRIIGGDGFLSASRPLTKRAFFMLSISQIRASSGPFDLIERDGEDPRTLPFLDRRAARCSYCANGNVAVWFMNGAQVTQFAGVATVPTVWSIQPQQRLMRC